ncbi:MAG: putative glycoside hydrolase [Candidatus Margulisbacteria bacterium]|nr:putative glycoside hydrolase [Candidatus Margulisiibacteriota bacterium]
MQNHLFKFFLGLIFVFVVILISSFSFQNIFEEIIPKQKVRSDKGIYITANVAQASRLFDNIKAQAKAAGINTLVIDGKSAIEKPLLALIKEKKLTSSTKLHPNPWLTKLSNALHQEGFIVTVRLVVFKDDHLAIARPDLAVHLSGGGIYRDRKGGKWADPYSDEVRLYNAIIAEIAALSGVDEVQFDYIRFPAEADAHNAQYPALKKDVSRVDIICTFLEEARRRTQKYNVSLAVDIFGVTAWQSQNDINSLGQDLKRMAKYIDVISPMLYPSHFHNGYDGFANPGSEPYYFIYAGTAKTKEILSGEAVAIIPWVQGFNLRSPNFGTGYISEQIKAAQDAGATGFLIWNARNDYSVPFRALKK